MQCCHESNAPRHISLISSLLIFYFLFDTIICSQHVSFLFTIHVFLFQQDTIFFPQKQECTQNVIAHTMTSRHTNVTETNLHLAFCTHRTVEARMHSHVKKRACTPTQKIACIHMSHLPARTGAFSQTETRCLEYGANMHVSMQKRCTTTLSVAILQAGMRPSIC